MYNRLTYEYTIYAKYVNEANNRPGQVSVFPLSVELLDLNGDVDCKIGSFYRNFWFRTPHGLKYKKYESEESLRRAVELLLRKNGLEVVEWRKE